MMPGYEFAEIKITDPTDALTARIEALEQGQRQFKISVMEQSAQDALRAAEAAAPPTLSPEDIDRLKELIEDIGAWVAPTLADDAHIYPMGIRSIRESIEAVSQILGMEE